MPRFVVDLGDVPMSKADEMALNQDLQKTALSHVSRLRFEQPFAVRFPWEWLGLVLRRDFEALKLGEKELGRALGNLPGGIAAQRE